ncbi:hypothetical protein PENSUB_4591 [Penicillium subrubescens]|uniref:Uncharacterized protein n=1 Tax=Penicillium subrubescens TaxID=1316194 RepID=A0A1Q5UC15_9EURO|nr:hypothetical protein PENSUB_4591 [Penicillium subrubescens]
MFIEGYGILFTTELKCLTEAGRLCRRCVAKYLNLERVRGDTAAGGCTLRLQSVVSRVCLRLAPTTWHLAWPMRLTGLYGLDSSCSRWEGIGCKRVGIASQLVPPGGVEA